MESILYKNLSLEENFKQRTMRSSLEKRPLHKQGLLNKQIQQKSGDPCSPSFPTWRLEAKGIFRSWWIDELK